MNKHIVLIVDGHNQVATTAYGAAGHIDRVPEMVQRRLFALIQRIRPVRMITAWDTPATTFRHHLLPAYKGGRSKLEGIEQAIAETRRLIAADGHAVLAVDGFEADDIIATATEDAQTAGHRVVIYSADRDLHQLIRSGAVSQLLRAGVRQRSLDMVWMTAGDLRVKYLVTPEQWVDFKCLVGDAGDNVKGIAGIGEQTAGRILQACGSLDAFYRNPFVAPVGNRQRESLIRAKSEIRILRELFTLRRDVVWETQPCSS